jgi:hypothetical protein|nr:MAG TPA: hypothetical protein [Caudoviricetes sp.]
MCLWKTPKISQPSVTARELTPSTEADTPNSPIYGGSDAWKQKRRGAQALQISRGTNSNNRVNVNDTGGWSI